MAKQVQFGRGVGRKVNLAELSGIMGIDVNTTRKCMGQGMPYKKINSRKYEFDTAACIHWRLQQEADKADDYGEQEEMKYDEAKRRKAVADALSSELDLEISRSTLAQIDDLMANFADALVSVRAQIIGMPNRLAGTLEYQEQKEIREILNQDIKQVLNGLSEYEHEYKGNEPES